MSDADDDSFASYCYAPAAVIARRTEPPPSIAERVAAAVVAGVKRVAARSSTTPATPAPPRPPRLLHSAADSPPPVSPHALRAYLGKTGGADDDWECGVHNAGSTASTASAVPPPPPKRQRPAAVADADADADVTPPASPTSTLLVRRGTADSSCLSTPRGGGFPHPLTLGRASPPPIPADEWRRTLAAEAAARAAAAARPHHRLQQQRPASAPTAPADRGRLQRDDDGGDAAVAAMTRSLDATWFFGGV